MQPEISRHFSLPQLEKRALEFVSGLVEKLPETRGTYERSLRQFLSWCRTRRGFTFSHRGVERYKSYLTREKRLSDVSVSTYLTALRRFCQHLVDRGAIGENPARFVVGNKRPMTHSRLPLNRIEVERLLRSIDPTTPRGVRDYAMVRTMLGCGLSEIEMIRANVGDMKKRNGQHILFVQGKGRSAKDQEVQIPREVATAIERYISTRASVLDADPLFLSAGNKVRGKRMTTRGIRERVNHYFRISGIKRKNGHVTPFSLRHTAAMLLVQKGATPEEIRQKMRLGSVATAMIYVKGHGEGQNRGLKD